MRTCSENLGSVSLERFLNQSTFLLISHSPSPLPPLSSFSPHLSCPLHSSLLFCFSLLPAWPCPSFTTLPQQWNTDLSIGITSVYHHAWFKETLLNRTCHQNVNGCTLGNEGVNIYLCNLKSFQRLMLTYFYYRARTTMECLVDWKPFQHILFHRYFLSTGGICVG